MSNTPKTKPKYIYIYIYIYDDRVRTQNQKLYFSAQLNNTENPSRNTKNKLSPSPSSSNKMIRTDKL